MAIFGLFNVIGYSEVKKKTKTEKNETKEVKQETKSENESTRS